MDLLNWWHGGGLLMWPTALSAVASLVALLGSWLQREPQRSRLLVLALGLAVTTAGIGALGTMVAMQEVELAILEVKSLDDRELIHLNGSVEARAPIILGTFCGLLAGLPAWLGLGWRRAGWSRRTAGLAGP